MKLFRRYRQSSSFSKKEALACIPVKSTAISEIRLDAGSVQVMYPVSLRPWMAKISKAFGAGASIPRYKKLQLDEMGTAVWDLIDGKRPVEQISKILAEKYRLHSRETEVSTAQFIRDLGRRGLIGLNTRMDRQI